MRIIGPLLSDAAQLDPQGKIHVLGLGWNHIPTPAPPIALVAFAELQPEELPAELEIRFELLDSDQTPLILPPDSNGNSGILSVTGKGSAKVPSEAWHREEPMLVPLMIQVSQGLPLEPGVYYFRATVTRESGETCSALSRFRVRPNDARWKPPYDS